ncbi:DUF4956 domain-containing protein [uncultured Slackia sp.]|uniref:DUF4956 domain-containing protein n=1 Tax=uncultured Slackia sp. TaxID=665903 RepID=UPI0026E10B6D|nr:DUF4956 domain-containing protein [uncultured Slackia sp.]
MLDSMFSSILSSVSSAAADVSAAGFFACCAASLILGAAVAGIYMFRHAYSKNFVVTLALLPVIVQMVIMLVNGNIGAGIAVMGVFNLVRFRSIPSSAKDIGSVFLAMAVGLATGMGFIGLAALFVAVVALANIAYVLSPFGGKAPADKTLRITVPEDFEYEGAFDGVLSRYASDHELVSVETTNLGSLYQLEYRVRLTQNGQQKKMLDEIRCHNGNLKVSLATAASAKEVL